MDQGLGRTPPGQPAAGVPHRRRRGRGAGRLRGCRIRQAAHFRGPGGQVEHHPAVLGGSGRRAAQGASAGAGGRHPPGRSRGRACSRGHDDGEGCRRVGCRGRRRAAGAAVGRPALRPQGCRGRADHGRAGDHDRPDLARPANQRPANQRRADQHCTDHTAQTETAQMDAAIADFVGIVRGRSARSSRGTPTPPTPRPKQSAAKQKPGTPTRRRPPRPASGKRRRTW